MKTIIYIDGYNLYYGAVHGSPYKWLDIVSLFGSICHQQNPLAEIFCVKFFTSPVKASISIHGNKSVSSQNNYHKALRSIYPDVLEIINGSFTQERGFLPRYKKPLDKTDKLEVWRLEEKKTDVNIALHMYRDVIKNKADQIVLVSNDSDLVPALEFIKEEKKDVTVGIVIPRRKSSDKKIRSSNNEMKNLSDWMRKFILDSELESSQMPQMVPSNKKPAYKPEYW